MKKMFFIASWSVALALILAACAPNESAAPLVGTTWKLTSYGLADAPEPAVSEEGFIIFSNDGTFTGIGACNRFEGDYEVKNDQLTLGSIVWDVGGNVFCPEPQMSQESGVWEVVKGTVDYKVEGKKLTISRNNIFLEFEAAANSTGN